MTAPAEARINILVLCGAADRPSSELGGRTPLDAAATPALDSLARRGVQGMITVIDHGICPESDSGIMALLGYDPHRYYTGRGALEALGLDFARDDDNTVGFRINFASYDSANGKLERRTARDLSDDELQGLVAAIRESDLLVGIDASVGIIGFGRHRGVLCLTAERELSAMVSNTDPGFRREGPFGVPNERHVARPLPCVPLDDSPAAAWTAELVNRLDEETSRVLRDHPVNHRRTARAAYPANRILFRDAGRGAPATGSFSSRYGRSFSLHGQVPAERGLCKVLGGTWHDARQGERTSDDDYFARLVADVTADDADVVVVHLKGADEPGHDGDLDAKRRAIEALDRLFVGPLMRARPADTFVVTCDHATPCSLGIHTADPVPLLISPGGGRAGQPRFSEREASRGSIGFDKATGLIDWLLADRRAEERPA